MRGVALCLCLISGPVNADFCADIRQVQQTGQGALLNGGTCQDVITLGVGPERVCYWEHGFRSPSALDQFETFVAALSQCLPAASADQIVNHPDSYDLRQFGTNLALSVSLKDKGALGQTLVFLRIARAPDG